MKAKHPAFGTVQTGEPMRITRLDRLREQLADEVQAVELMRAQMKRCYAKDTSPFGAHDWTTVSNASAPQQRVGTAGNAQTGGFPASVASDAVAEAPEQWHSDAAPRFKVGQRVTVLSGAHAGDSGDVAAVSYDGTGYCVHLDCDFSGGFHVSQLKPAQRQPEGWIPFTATADSVMPPELDGKLVETRRANYHFVVPGKAHTHCWDSTTGHPITACWVVS